MTSKEITGVLSGTQSVSLDIPIVNGYKPLFYVANPQSWFPNQIVPILPTYKLYEDSKTLDLTYIVEGSINVTGGNFSAMIAYIKNI